MVENSDVFYEMQILNVKLGLQPKSFYKRFEYLLDNIMNLLLPK